MGLVIAWIFIIALWLGGCWFCGWAIAQALNEMECDCDD